MTLGIFIRHAPDLARGACTAVIRRFRPNLDAEAAWRERAQEPVFETHDRFEGDDAVAAFAKDAHVVATVEPL